MSRRTRIVVALLAYLLGLLIGLRWHMAEAVELKEVSINEKHFFLPNYTPYFQGSQHDRITLNLNSDLIPGLFWNNRIHGTTDGSQYRWIGWNFSVGARLTQVFDVQYEHHSQHILDTTSPFPFPFEDSVGFTLHLVRPKAATVF